MPTVGPYSFKLSSIAVDGFVPDERVHEMARGEWAWIDRTEDLKKMGIDGGRFLMIYACCPDCNNPLTLYRKRGEKEPQGHAIDKDGNVHPSVLHTWQINDVEQCGFHTQPTTLLGFVDKR